MSSRRAPAPFPIVAAGLLPDDAAILRTVSRRTSFEAGRHLAELGRARSIMVSNDGRRISAVVMDLPSGSYSASIELFDPRSPGNSFYGRCTCGTRQKCKHVVAVLLALRQRQEKPAAPTRPAPPPQRGAASPPGHPPPPAPLPGPPPAEGRGIAAGSARPPGPAAGPTAGRSGTARRPGSLARHPRPRGGGRRRPRRAAGPAADALRADARRGAARRADARSRL